MYQVYYVVFVFWKLDLHVETVKKLLYCILQANWCVSAKVKENMHSLRMIVTAFSRA